ncbi:MAG: hypothetical protein IJO79_02880 [Firmicutes bacterium]|nr:hypothetical protein [Bacillota bacterium]
MKKRRKRPYRSRKRGDPQGKRALGVCLALLGGILVIQGVPVTVWYVLLVLLAVALIFLLIRCH